MPYILKKGVEAFEVVDGPLAGRKFVPGKTYAEIPPQEKAKFKSVAPPETRSPAAAKKVDKPKAKEA